MHICGTIREKSSLNSALAIHGFWRVLISGAKLRRRGGEGGGGRCGARTKQESFTKTSGQTGTIRSTQNVCVTCEYRWDYIQQWQYKHIRAVSEFKSTRKADAKSRTRQRRIKLRAPVL